MAARVQSTGKFRTSLGTSISGSFGSLPSTGSLIIVGVQGTGLANWADGDVTDNQGNNYDRAVVNNGGTDCAIFYAVVTTSSGTFTVTVNPANLGNTQIVASAVEYSGAWTFASCVDQTATNAGTSTTPSTGTTGALQSSSEVSAIVMNSSGTTQASITVESVTPSWVEEHEELSNTFIPGEFDTRILTSASATSGSWTLASSSGWVACIATFKEFEETLPVPAGSLKITGSTPSVFKVLICATGLGALAVTGHAPIPSAAETIAVPVGALTMSGHAPDVLVGSSGLEIPTGALEISGNYFGIAFIQPAVGRVLISGHAPSISPLVSRSMPAGSLEITGHPPTLSQGLAEAGPLRVTYMGNLGTAGANAHGLFCGQVGVFNVGLAKSAWPIAGDLENLIIRLSVAPGVGSSRTFNVKVNGATVATLTLSDGTSEARISGTVATLAPDDLVYLEQTASGSPAAASHTYLTVEFISTTDNEHAYTGNIGLFTTGITRYINPFYPLQVESALFPTPVATPVTMTGISLSTHLATLTGGDGIVATVYLSTDGGDTYVAQNGSGGTPDTRTTYVNQTVDDVVTNNFILSFDRGDMVYVEVVAQGTPSDWFSMATAFLCGVPGETNYARADSSGDPGNTQINYTRAQSAGSIAWALTETTVTSVIMYAGETGFVLKEPYAYALTPPGSGAGRRLNLRRNFGSTSVTVVQAGILTPVVASGTGAQSYDDGDVLDVEHVPTGTPATNGAYRWTYIMAAVLPDEREPPGGGGGVDGGEPPDPSEVPTGVMRRFFTLTNYDGQVLGAADTDLYADLEEYFGGYKPAELLSISPIERELPRKGDFRGIEVRILLADTHRRWRVLATQEALATAYGAIYVVSDESRYALLKPYRKFAGRVVEHKALDHDQYEIVLRDVVSEQIATLDMAPLVPPQVLTEAEFPGLYDRTEGRAAPLLLGEVSDEGELVPQGVVQPLIVAGINLSYFGGINQPVIACLWSLGALAANGVWRVYYNPPSLPSTRVLVPNSAFGNNIWTPGMPGWVDTGLTTDYVDYPLPLSAETRRYTPVFLSATDPLSEPFLNEQVLVAANLFGIAENGDGSGLYISDPSRAWQWIVVNQLFVPYTTGEYAPMPALDGVYQVVDTVSVERTRDRQHARLTGGYPIGFMLGRDGQQTTYRHAAEELCYGTDMQQGINRHGQLMIDTEDASALPVARLSDLLDIETGSFEVKVDRDWFFNRMDRYHGYRYVAPTAPNPAPPEGHPVPKPINDYNPWLSGVIQEVHVGSVLSNRGINKKLVFENYVVRDDDVAQDIATTLLNRAVGPAPSYDGPRVFRLVVSLERALPLELGDNILIDHVDGYGANGYIGAFARIMKIADDTDEWKTTIEGYILSAGSPA